MPQEPPTSIRLRIKVPPGHIAGAPDDFVLPSEVAVNSTVGQVRQLIQQTVTTNPAPERQRLLYGGRALTDNDQTLQDAFNMRRDPTQTEYTIHLLVRDAASAASAPQQAQRPPQQLPHIQPHGQPHPHHLPAFAHGHLPPHMLQAHQQALQGHQAARTTLQPLNFQQVVTQGQQNRAAMGMQGVMPTGAPPVPQVPQQQPPQPERSQSTAGQMPHGQQLPQGQQAQSAQQVPGSQGEQNPELQQHGLPRRPVSNQGFHVEGVNQYGSRFSIHHQTLQFGGPGQPGQLPFAIPNPFPHQPAFGMHMPPGLPNLGLPQQQNPVPGPSALDRARNNINDMDRTLQDLRSASDSTDEHRAHIQSLEQGLQVLRDYIDPFALGNAPQNNFGGRRTAPPQGNAFATFAPPPPIPGGPPLQMPGPPVITINAATNIPRPRTNVPDMNNVTCYLLSSPSGPEALLYSPQHGVFDASLQRQPSPFVSGLPIPPTVPAVPAPTPTVAAGNNDNNAAADAQAREQVRDIAQMAVQAPAPAGQPPQQQRAQGQGEQNAVQAILGHFWLLFRLLIFAYFFLGANLGWRRPLILIVLGLGFFAFRYGLFGEGGLLRRWWEDLVGAQQNPQRNENRNQQATTAPGNAQPNQQQNGVAGAAARPGQMPTPEQLAERLINEERNRRAARFAWFRAVERTFALLVASLWPGVGEGLVRAREAEERARMEAEVAAARQREEERLRAEEEEKKRVEGSEEGVEKKAEEGERSTVDGSASAGEGTAQDEAGEIGVAGGSA